MALQNFGQDCEGENEWLGSCKDKDSVSYA